MLIAIPSKGRPARQPSKALISCAKVFLSEIDYDDYARAKVPDLVAVPAAIAGITRTRNWILDWAAEHEPDRRVVMIDDDMFAQGWAEVLPDWKFRHRKLTEPEWIREWSRLFDLSEDTGFRLWGVATTAETRAIRTYRPFYWQTYVTASCCGMRADSGLRFDESFAVKEDYELCLRAIRDDGGVVGARYVYWVNGHWRDRGGCRDYRTQEVERDATDRLMKMYPGLIRKVTRGGSKFSIQLDFD